MITEKRPALASWLLAACFAPSLLPAAEPPALTIPELDPKFDNREVTLTFTVAGTEGVSQLARPGKPMTFIIETVPEQDMKALQVWVRGDLADVMERLQMGLFSPNLKKGTVIQATGLLHYSPPTVPAPQSRQRWYYFDISDWKKFRIVTEPDSAAKQ